MRSTMVDLKLCEYPRPSKYRWKSSLCKTISFIINFIPLQLGEFILGIFLWNLKIKRISWIILSWKASTFFECSRLANLTPAMQLAKNYSEILIKRIGWIKGLLEHFLEQFSWQSFESWPSDNWLNQKLTTLHLLFSSSLNMKILTFICYLLKDLHCTTKKNPSIYSFFYSNLLLILWKSWIPWGWLESEQFVLCFILVHYPGINTCVPTEKMMTGCHLYCNIFGLTFDYLQNSLASFLIVKK